ncbi:MAG: hypothetical protein IKV13_00125 [Akkermansia sp.]|nr:hypothetical protein [Akkermansia sp.]
MKIPPYWIMEKRRGSDGTMWKLRGISYRSMAEARERLEERARLQADFARRRRVSEDEVEEHRANLRALDELREEDYSVLLLEPVIETLDGSNVITRNRYGVQVLNSTSLCFVDVDAFPLSLGDTLRGLFGRKVTPEEKLLQRLRELCEADESLGARLYRTHHGWRVMLVGAGITPDSDRMHGLFKALHADALYESLCARQQCWRARLTPKPYRVGITRFPRPMDSEAAHSADAQIWLQKYETLCAGKAVCRLVDCMGRAIQSAEVELHDRMTQALVPDAPLA